MATGGPSASALPGHDMCIRRPVQLNTKPYSIILLCLCVLSPGTALAADRAAVCSIHMDVTDPHQEVTAEAGASVRFGDIGCAVAWRELQCARDTEHFDSTARVSDFLSAESVPMTQAYYVVSEADVSSPVGYGIAAFARLADAEVFAVPCATEPIGFQELVRRHWPYRER